MLVAKEGHHCNCDVRKINPCAVLEHNVYRAVFRGGAGGATAPPDVFDLLQNSETNLQKYWAFKLALVVKSNIS